MTLTVHQLRVRATATGPLHLHVHTGGSLRGAFYGALWGRFCVNQTLPTCAACPLVQVCPVSALVAPLRDEPRHGRDVPRPYAIRPPVHHAGTFGPGDRFAWGLTLFGQPVTLFPYVAMSLHEMGRHGVGKRVPENDWERGRFVVETVEAVNTLTGEVQTIQAAASPRISTPTLPTTWDDAVAVARRLPTDQLTLRFATPLRLIDQKQLVRRPLMRPLIQRLLKRHDELSLAYGGTPFSLEERTTVLAAADAVTLQSNQTQWLDLESYSQRQRQRTPIGGLLGVATYTGDLAPILPLLVWGSVIQVGKDTTKGNGVYEILHGSLSREAVCSSS